MASATRQETDSHCMDSTASQGCQDQRFVYRQLDHDNSTIRLLKLQFRRNKDELVQCEIANKILAPQTKFQAVSYVWGMPSDHAIRLNGHIFHVRENLHDFLAIKAGDEQFCASSVLWIDQICIDQDNVLERNHQVAQMSKIYSSAENVYVWLGTGSRETDWAMEWLQDTHSAVRNKEEEYDLNYIRAVQTLCTSYFDRLWIVQEILLAVSIKVCMGQKMIDWKNLRSAAMWLRDRASAIPTQTHWDKQTGAFWHIPDLDAMPPTQKMLRAWFPDFNMSKLATLIEAREKKKPKRNPTWAPTVTENAFVGYQDMDESETTQGTLFWSDTLAMTGDAQCSDIRDKVYGVLGLVDPAMAIPVDYSQSPEQVLVSVLNAHAKGSHLRTTDLYAHSVAAINRNLVEQFAIQMAHILELDDLPQEKIGAMVEKAMHGNGAVELLHVDM